LVENEGYNVRLDGVLLPLALPLLLIPTEDSRSERSIKLPIEGRVTLREGDIELALRIGGKRTLALPIATPALIGGREILWASSCVGGSSNEVDRSEET
jgi:hypothetical protein